MARDGLEQRIAILRGFNRFYTKKIGLLNRGLLETRFPLIQARIRRIEVWAYGIPLTGLLALGSVAAVALSHF